MHVYKCDNGRNHCKFFFFFKHVENWALNWLFSFSPVVRDVGINIPQSPFTHCSQCSREIALQLHLSISACFCYVVRWYTCIHLPCCTTSIHAYICLVVQQYQGMHLSCCAINGYVGTFYNSDLPYICHVVQ